MRSFTIDPAHQGHYTLEDYYALPDDIRAKLIDGVLFIMNPPTLLHQNIAGFHHGGHLPIYPKKGYAY